MLNVLRHYLPFRKALLIGSEMLLITLVVMAVMSSHLWSPGETTTKLLAFDSLDPATARWKVATSSLLVALLAQLTLAFNELYDFRVSSSRFERMARFLTSSGSGVLLVIISLAFATKLGVHALEFPAVPFAQAVVLLTSALFAAFLLVFLWRHLFHLILRRSSFRERLLVLGTGRAARRLMDEIHSRENTGVELVALLARSDEPRDRRRTERRGGPDNAPTGNPWFEASQPAEDAQAARESLSETKLLLSPAPGTSLEEAAASARPIEPLPELARRLAIDLIVVAFEERRGSLPTDELLQCRLDGVLVEEAESFFERMTGKIPAEAMRPSYLIFNRGFDMHPLAAAAKRLCDFSLALLGLLLAWPVMLAVALAVRLDSAGPMLFRQERTGQRGRPFTLYKFRSMRTDAEKLSGPVWASEDDPRITRVGRFIRKTRLDELPQLFNILLGSMSLVGPRPERPHFVAELAQKIPYYNQRHILKPGLTGWAQINYPYGNTVEDALQKLQYDLFYIKYQSLLFDVSILFNTVKTVLLRKGT
ncbi:MAG: TIGR03013 family PEP-CTERM/XrtA system glycosyltransferase [Planctomycetes bacterium]|nr:TIGR03013 family PEP-CTERM/XrtA system glycosyltransferase [Planctomycetota bacterium]